MIDRDEVARLIAEETFPYELNPEWERVTNVKVIEAASLVVDPDTLIISKVDGEWPESVVKELAAAFARPWPATATRTFDFATDVLDALLEGQPK